MFNMVCESLKGQGVKQGKNKSHMYYYKYIQNSYNLQVYYYTLHKSQRK